MSWQDIIKTVANVAPTIGSALGVPGIAAGAAIKTLSNYFLGKPNGTQDEITQAIISADPDKLLKFREQDYTFSAEMGRQALDQLKVEQTDRADARAHNSYITDILAFVITVGFFGVLYIALKVPIPPEEQALANIMVGVLGTAWISVVQYYFGSSSGSKIKDWYLSKK